MVRVHIPSSLLIPIDPKTLATVCGRYRVLDLSLFGDVLGDYFTDSSDVDVLVKFVPKTPVTLFLLSGLITELESMFRRTVHLVHEPALRPFLRDEILSTREVIYDQTPVSL